MITEIIVKLLGSKFVNLESQNLNLACCELLETLIKGIDDP